MADSVDFYQIYYKDEQLAHLYDFAIPYRNQTLTPYFENSVICNLVPKSDADYIAVCSWSLRQKRTEATTPIILKNQLELSKEKILSYDFDVAVLMARSKSHKPLYMASHWHGKAWDEAIELINREFIRVPLELTNAIYGNHFIARREIYHEYVSKVLQPCIHYMDMLVNRSVFHADSGYRRKIEKRQPDKVKLYCDKTGREDWPISAFVLERLFSIWIENKTFNIINL